MAETEKSYRRVNITLLESQYDELSQRGLNVSGIIRDLLGDYLSENAITLQVSEETKRVYDLVISNMGGSDEEVEVYLRAALAKVLDKKIGEMKKLKDKLVS